jgi:hypothetical protein
MKYTLCCLIVLLSLQVRSQDTIYFKNLEKRTILLLEVNPDNIKYKRFDNQAGATYTSLKSEILYITLSNGKKEVFEKESTPVTIAKTDSLISPTKDSIAKPADIAKPAPVSDTIYFKSGKKSAVKMYEITDSEVRYKPLANLDGPVYKSYKGEVKEILFSTGLKQKFETPASPVNSETGGLSSPKDYSLKGARDAKTYYRHRGGSIAVGIISVVPLAGLIPAIICSSVPPREYNMGYPDDRLWQNKDYRYGYSKEAYRIKRKRIWRAFGIGAGTGILIALLSG